MLNIFKSKKDLLEEKLQLQREDLYNKGKILLNNNKSIEALEYYKESYIEFAKTKKEIDEINLAEKERIENLKKEIHNSNRYKTAKAWYDVFDNLINKCEKTYKHKK